MQKQDWVTEVAWLKVLAGVKTFKPRGPLTLRDLVGKIL